MKTSNWLIEAVGGPERAEKIKANALKKADKEIDRKKKKERKKEMRAYRQMHRRHRRELVKLAKEVRPFDWGWLDDLVFTQVKHMYEYFSAGNNVWQTDETRLPIVEQLKHVLDLYEEMDHLYETYPSSYIVNDDSSVTTMDGCQNYINREKRRQELFEEIYSYVGCHIQKWWD